MKKKLVYIMLLTTIISFAAGISEASSDLELKGTVFTRPVTTKVDGKESCNGARSLKPIAIIKDKASGRVNMYYPGENIGNTVLLEIRRAEVILLEGKRKYALSLPGGSVKQPKDISEDISIKRQAGTFYISKADIGNALSRIKRLMRDIKVMPHFSKGMPQGMRLSSIREGSIFEKAGVKKGDIVKSVNGMTLNTPNQIFKAYKNLKDEESLRVEIVREGKPVVLSYIIK